MKIQGTLVILAFFLIFSCRSNQEKIPPTFAPKVVEVKGYVVPKDSLAAPKVIPVGKTRVIVAKKPKVVRINTNVHLAGIPKVVPAGLPQVCTPGQDGFILPKTIPAIDSQFMAGIPEVVPANEDYSKEQNSKNFSFFGKLQGLKSAAVQCLLQDKNGNIWIGTRGGGVSKYDGKSFTHFSVKEGLGNSFVRNILEDSNGNIWFSTWEGGVSRYDGKSFTCFTKKEGLCDNVIWSMLEDKSKNLWFGTYSGVNKYDGKNFTHYSEKQGLSDDTVNCILQDQSGNLWFGTKRGISKFDGKSFSQYSKKEGLSDNNVLSILEDISGNLWFGTDGGVNKYDGKNFTHFTEKEGLANNSVTSILEDKGHNLWFGTFGGGISKYDGKSFTHFTKKEGLSNNFIFNSIEDNHGNLWFGTNGGVNKLNTKGFIYFTTKEGLSDNTVNNILEDKNGSLWFATLNGVTKYDGKSFSHFTAKEGLVNSAIWCMLEDKDGNLWFGSYYGLSKYDGKNFTYYSENEGLIGNDVKSILEDKKGNLWFGTTKGLSKYDGKTFTQFTRREGLSTDIVVSILRDKIDNLWFSGYIGGITKYDGNSFTHFTKKQGLGHNDVRSMLQDKSGNLWFGTIGAGLYKYDGSTFTNFTESEGLSNNNVGNMLEDKDGNLWFGTNFGLNKLEKEKLSLYENAAFDTKDRVTAGHTSNKVAKNNFKGSVQEAESEVFKTYTFEEGFSGVGVIHGKSIYEAKDGTIWVGTEDRLTVFHPDEEIPDTIVPNIQVTGISLFNENIAWQNLLSSTVGESSKPSLKDTAIVLANGTSVHDFQFDDVSKWYGLPERLSLAYNNNYLTFQFVGITTQSPKKVKYKFKLEGIDENWSALTNRSEATYGNLPHGKYTFKVKAMNGDGYWSKEFNYTFTIRPPWWHTWWAYTLFALLFIGFIYALFRYRLNKIRMRHEILLQQHKAAELEMQALRAQMNPHFIFNSLNSINLFILENNKLQASEYLAKFSRLVRLILNNSQESFIPLENELEALHLYLELESLRFEQRFHYQITVEDSVDTTLIKVPPLIIQPYAENAIWHGLMHKKDEGHLEIQLYQKEEILFCKITDDGVGRKTAAQLKSKSVSKSVGMRITADRIAILQDSKQNNAYVTVTDLVLPDGTPGGTEVLVRIPVLS